MSMSIAEDWYPRVEIPTSRYVLASSSVVVVQLRRGDGFKGVMAVDARPLMIVEGGDQMQSELDMKYRHERVYTPSTRSGVHCL